MIVVRPVFLIKYCLKTDCGGLWRLLIFFAQTVERHKGPEEIYWNDVIMTDWIQWLDDRC
jgi:hypothetical protein